MKMQLVLHLYMASDGFINRDLDKTEKNACKMESSDSNIKSRKTMKPAKLDQTHLCTNGWFIQAH